MVTFSAISRSRIAKTVRSVGTTHLGAVESVASIEPETSTSSTVCRPAERRGSRAHGTLQSQAPAPTAERARCSQKAERQNAIGFDGGEADWTSSSLDPCVAACCGGCAAGPEHRACPHGAGAPTLRACRHALSGPPRAQPPRCRAWQVRRRPTLPQLACASSTRTRVGEEQHVAQLHGPARSYLASAYSSNLRTPRPVPSSPAPESGWRPLAQ